jgi:hypothetical protein
MPEKTLLPVSSSVLSSQSHGSKKQPGISSLSLQFLIYWIKKPAGTKLEECGGWDNTGIPRFTKNSEKTPEDCAGTL